MRPSKIDVQKIGVCEYADSSEPGLASLFVAVLNQYEVESPSSRSEPKVTELGGEEAVH